MDFDEFDDDDQLGELGGEAGGDQAGIFDNQDAEFMPDLISKRDAVIFLVDCNKQLFDPTENNETQFKVILKSIQSFYKSKIISSVDDKVGLIFYNVKQSKNDMGFSGCTIVHELDSPSAENIKGVLKLDENFERNFGYADAQTPFYESLWLCNSIFQKLDAKRFIMRIFLFTNNDNPHEGDAGQIAKCALHAKTLAEKNIEIELFPLCSNHQKFDIRKFFANVITFDVEDLNEAVIDTSDKILDLQHRLRQKEFKKRAINRLLFTLGDDVKLGVKLYCPFIKQKRPLARYLDSVTNKPLKRTVKNICTTTGQVLYQNQISTCAHIGGEKVKLSKEDIAKIKEFEEPGMTLIGFKPANELKAYHNYRTSYFVYPDENRVQGSSQSFHAFISQMIAKDKIAIVKFIARKGTQLRFCALLPQEESYDEDHVQTPPGFNLIFLPYADDLRNLGTLRPQNKEDVSRNLLNSAKVLCNALEIQNFDLHNFEDPSLQKFYAHLQAHALGENNPENPPDLLQPDEEGMKRYEETLKLFEDALKLECGEEEKEQPKPKKAPRQPKSKGPELVMESKKPAGKKEIKKKEPNGSKKPAVARKRGVKKEEAMSEENSSVGEYDSGDSFIDDSEDEIKPKKRGQQKKGVKGEDEDYDFDSEDDNAGSKKKGKQQQKRVKKEEYDFSDSNDHSSKNKKQQNVDKDLEEAMLVSLVDQKLRIDYDPDSLTMEELRQYLKLKGLRLTGKKSELVERILTYAEQHN